MRPIYLFAKSNYQTIENFSVSFVCSNIFFSGSQDLRPVLELHLAGERDVRVAAPGLGGHVLLRAQQVRQNKLFLAFFLFEAVY